MIIISHRGNTNGIDLNQENNPQHIQKLLNFIQVEVDVWLTEKGWYLGHDCPFYPISLDFLKHPNLWCHAKNLNALENLLKNNVRCFWHQEDDYTLTSDGFIWTYPNKLVSSKSIIVDLSQEWQNKNYYCFGVCVDYVTIIS